MIEHLSLQFHIVFRFPSNAIFVPYVQELGTVSEGQYESSQLTLAFCASTSAAVKMGAIAKGSRSQVIGFSCRFVAGLSPMALFLPTTNLLHLLQRDVKHDICMTEDFTHSSDKEYRAFR
jgi:hypothetical protein